MKKNDLWYAISCTAGWEKKKITEKIFEEIMTKNFSYLMTKLNVHIQEIPQIPSRKNSNRSLLIHMITTPSKSKDWILKAARVMHHIRGILNTISHQKPWRLEAVGCHTQSTGTKRLSNKNLIFSKAFLQKWIRN